MKVTTRFLKDFDKFYRRIQRVSIAQNLTEGVTGVCAEVRKIDRECRKAKGRRR